MKNKIYLVLVGIFMIAHGPVLAQQKLDSYFDHLLSNRKFMGSVAISFKDSIIYAKSVGYVDADQKTSINQDTKFRIGSLTKTFTAALVIKAIEEGKLKLDNKLDVFYPEIKNADRITIEQLLKHRSGIFNFTEITGEQKWETLYHTEKEFVDYVAKEKSNFEPGAAYEYSNTNFALLGFILERTYKKTFAEILEENICRPLKLNNTYYSFAVDVSKNEALSYNIQNRYRKNGKVNFSNHPGSGGIVSNAIDVNKFLFALFNGKFISTNSLQTMLPINKGEYGMGIQKLSFDNPEGYEHGGRIENYISDYWYFPKEKLGIVTLSNAININMDDINVVLLKYAYGTLPKLPDFNKIDALPAPEFSKISGTYLGNEEKESVTISSDGKEMVFQDSRVGQDYVFFDYKGDNVFQYENITLQFFPKKNEMHLEQGNIKKVYKKIQESARTM